MFSRNVALFRMFKYALAFCHKKHLILYEKHLKLKFNSTSFFDRSRWTYHISSSRTCTWEVLWPIGVTCQRKSYQDLAQVTNIFSLIEYPLLFLRSEHYNAFEINELIVLFLLCVLSFFALKYSESLIYVTSLSVVSFLSLLNYFTWIFIPPLLKTMYMYIEE